MVRQYLRRGKLTIGKAPSFPFCHALLIALLFTSPLPPISTNTTYYFVLPLPLNREMSLADIFQNFSSASHSSDSISSPLTDRPLTARLVQPLQVETISAAETRLAKSSQQEEQGLLHQFFSHSSACWSLVEQEPDQLQLESASPPRGPPSI